MNTENQGKHLPSLAPGPRGPVAAGATTLAKSRKNSTACLPCKQAKRKCSGRPPPCKACQNTGADCIFDETLDLRRKVAARRTQGELEYYRGLLYSLLETLRSADEEKARRMLERIRGNVDLNDITAAIDEPANDLSDGSSEHSKGAEDAISQHERLLADAHLRITVEKLCDNPLFRMPSGPWTTITNDDHLISHLISLYFTWDHPLLQVVDQDIFLNQMCSRDKNSECCSSLLVNSMLAVASIYSDFPEVFAIPDDETSRGQHFYNEAERLWKAEEGQVSLVNIQAVALMSRFLKFQGKENLSWLMLRQAVQLGQDFGMFTSPRTRHRQWEVMPSRMQHLGAITAWGIFICNSQTSLQNGKVAELKPPRYKPYLVSGIDDHILWTPYPRFNQVDYVKKPAHLRFVATKMIELTEIVIDVQALLFDKGLDMSIGELWMAAGGIYVRLKDCLGGLPDILDSEDEKVPQVLCVYIGYHHTIVTLFRFFLEHQQFGPASHPSEFEQAKQKQLQSAKEIVQYLRLYHESYGLRQIPRQILEPTNSSLLVLLGLDDDDSKDAFVELCRFMVAFSKRLALAKEMLRNLEGIVRSARLRLPPEAVAVLDHKGLETSQWL
ncbi:C6 transcription factor [Aspergillus heteromorphus CBS 117.55]|uniref:C6 transcription factor n=1 Tax=Aspergillus heteromorphus CBS 117.55 TaxID=1448321 RepID=A0A317VL62_9EURO|nr:C6 transcription factor [Aspergillus heteromorphus CBS 117.55]PWY73678.1 C6 transcription factor [Aspergillus heteromorphus CBS 117.55]